MFRGGKGKKAENKQKTERKPLLKWTELEVKSGKIVLLVHSGLCVQGSGLHLYGERFTLCCSSLRVTVYLA